MLITHIRELHTVINQLSRVSIHIELTTVNGSENDYIFRYFQFIFHAKIPIFQKLVFKCFFDSKARELMRTFLQPRFCRETVLSNYAILCSRCLVIKGSIHVPLAS